MPKVGLKETLALLAAGYKKKDIEALAEIDDQQEETPAPDPVPAPAPVEETPAPDPVPAPAPVEETPKQDAPDYKAMYEDLLAKNKESEAKITKLQKDNIHKDSSAISYEEKQKEEESLQALVRGFM